jgi:hypothetical protein
MGLLQGVGAGGSERRGEGEGILLAGGAAMRPGKLKVVTEADLFELLRIPWREAFERDC